MKQELKQLVTGEENRFIQALTAVKLAQCSVEEIKQPLRYVMVKVGLRAQNWPTEEETVILISHIVKEYGNHTPDEVMLAFDMAIAGKLPMGEKEEVTCYENFSCLYFSVIMNAYRRWAAQVYVQTQPLKAIEGPKEELSDITMRDWMEDVKKRKMAVEFMPVMIYEWLEKKGELVKTAAEKKEYLQNAVEYRQSKLAQACEENNCEENRVALRIFMAMKDSGEFTGPEVNTLKSLAKKMILFDYLYNDN